MKLLMIPNEIGNIKEKAREFSKKGISFNIFIYCNRYKVIKQYI